MEREPSQLREQPAAQTRYDDTRDAAPMVAQRRSIPQWTLILAAAVAVLAMIAYFVMGDGQQVVTTDTLPQPIGPQVDPPPVTSPTPATPAPSPEPATPAQPPTPVQ